MWEAIPRNIAQLETSSLVLGYDDITQFDGISARVYVWILTRFILLELLTPGFVVLLHIAFSCLRHQVPSSPFS